ncbi:MAG: XdhC family protein [Firmicutes bacterium]|nr:XdhC family protein [Bacillota bacterium]
MSSIREARAHFRAARDWHAAGHRVAWLTLVDVKGSAYRRPGAKMVMASNGRMQGTLSGGCLEGDLYLHAEKAWENGTPSLHQYDLTEDEMWGLGIGCKGQVTIWIEPMNPTDPFWQAFGQALETDAPLVWGGELPQGLRYFGRPTEGWTLSGDGEWGVTPEALMGQGAIGRQETRWWDVMRPPERLIVAGAGHDAKPVVALAYQAGFDVVVLDPREHVNTDRDFPHAEHWLKSASDLTPDMVRESFWVIMNHHQRRDEETLKLASQSQPKFLGVLGPRARTEEMLAKTGVDGASLPLHSPVGLDLGAESPEEVAVSIVGELIAARQGRTGGSLNGRERIHA